MIPSSPLQRQPSVGNVLARTSSFGSNNYDLNRSSSGSSIVQRQSSSSSTGNKQGSPSSIFEQFTNQAKELVRETKRQSSQDGILAQMDKVRISSYPNSYSNYYYYYDSIVIVC